MISLVVVVGAASRRGTTTVPLKLNFTVCGTFHGPANHINLAMTYDKPCIRRSENTIAQDLVHVTNHPFNYHVFGDTRTWHRHPQADAIICAPESIRSSDVCEGGDSFLRRYPSNHLPQEHVEA